MNIEGIIVMIAAMIVSFIFGDIYGMHCTFNKIKYVFGEEVWRKILEGLHYSIENDISEEDKE